MPEDDACGGVVGSRSGSETCFDFFVQAGDPVRENRSFLIEMGHIRVHGCFAEIWLGFLAPATDTENRQQK
jgi:hypothetical protein